MKTQIAMLLSLFAVVLTAGPVLAHSGGLDSYGCHHNRKHGGYHCHRGPLAGQSYVSQQEMLNALEALNQVPNDHPEWVQPPDPSDPSKKAPEAYTILRT
jgi:hypothetical protein